MEIPTPPARWLRLLSMALGFVWWGFGLSSLVGLSVVCLMNLAAPGLLGLVVALASAWQWLQPCSRSRPIEFLRCLLLAIPVTPLGVVLAWGFDVSPLLRGPLLVPKSVAISVTVYFVCVVLMLVDRLWVPADEG